MEFVPLSPLSRVHCNLLSVDLGSSGTFRVLLDCGWREDFDPSLAKALRGCAPLLDAIVITHGTVSHIAALPYLIGVLRVSCPVYATVPATRLGHLTCVEMFYNRSTDIILPSVDCYTAADIDTTFFPNRITEVDFEERVELPRGLTLQSVCAGHTLGGSAWKITSISSDTILYNPECSTSRNFFLPSISQLNFLRSEIILVSSSCARRTVCSESFEACAEPILKTICETLHNNGNVLIPCDAGVEVLPFLLYVDREWRKKGMANYPLVFLSHTAIIWSDLIKSLSSYASEDVQRAALEGKNNPLDLKRRKNMLFCRDITEIRELSGPKAVFATPFSMCAGWSQELLLMWCDDPKNTIISLDQSNNDGVMKRIVDDMNEARRPSTYTLRVFSRETGEEYDDSISETSSSSSSTPIKSRNFNNLDEIHSPSSDGEIDQNTSRERILNPKEGEIRPGVFVSREVRGALRKNQGLLANPAILQFPFSDPTSPTCAEYGSDIPRELLCAWRTQKGRVKPNVEQVRESQSDERKISEYTCNAQNDSENHIDEHATEIGSSALQEHGATQVVGRLDLSKKLRNYNVQCREQIMQLRAKVYSSILVPCMDFTALTSVLRSLSEKTRKVCFIGSKEENESVREWVAEYLPESRVWYAEDTTAKLVLSSPIQCTIHIHLETLKSGRQHHIASEDCNLLTLRGEFVPFKESNGDREAETENDDSSRRAQQDHYSIVPSSEKVYHTPPTVFVGESSSSSISTSLQRSYVNHTSHLDMLMLQDSLLLHSEKQGDLCMEMVVSSTALNARRAVRAHFVEI